MKKIYAKKRALDTATKAGEVFGILLINIALLCIKSTIIWALLDTLAGVEVAWLKVFGIFCVYKFLILEIDYE